MPAHSTVSSRRVIPRKARPRQAWSRLLVWALLFGAPSVLLCAAGEDNNPWAIDKLEWSADPGQLTTVQATNLWGELRIRRSDTAQVRVLAHAQRDSRAEYTPHIVTHAEDGVLEVSAEFLEGVGNESRTATRVAEPARIDMTLLVPAGMNLEARVGDDLLQARGLRAAVSASSESGNLELSSHGRMVARSESGRIAAAFLSPQPSPGSRFETATGAITLWLDWSASATVEATTEGRVTSDVSTDISRPISDHQKTVRAVFGDGAESTIQVHSKNGNLTFLRRAP